MTRVLAVDDARTLREMLARCLAGAGHEVVQATNGREALEKLRETRPHIVITDLNMPVMDGLKFIESARAEASGRNLPILLLTTETRPRLEHRARAAGATGWLSKPFDAHTVLDLVERLT